MTRHENTYYSDLRGDSENYRPTAWPVHIFRKPGIKVIQLQSVFVHMTIIFILRISVP